MCYFTSYLYTLSRINKMFSLYLCVALVCSLFFSSFFVNILLIFIFAYAQEVALYTQRIRIRFISILPSYTRVEFCCDKRTMYKYAAKANPLWGATSYTLYFTYTYLKWQTKLYGALCEKGYAATTCKMCYAIL